MARIAADDYYEVAKVSEPRISPDGNSVAFVRQIPRSEREYEATIYEVPIGGGTPSQYTPSAGTDSEPRWSPDGNRLAFVNSRDGSADLWIKTSDDREPERVTTTVGNVSNIAWSPDGEHLLFLQDSSQRERAEELDLGNGTGDYERSPPDPRVITDFTYRTATEYVDGRHTHVYTVDVDDGTVRRVTDGERNHRSPDWGAAGVIFYAVSNSDEPGDSVGFDIVRRDLSDDQPDTICETRDWDPLAGSVPTLTANTKGQVAFTEKAGDKPSLRSSNLSLYHPDRGESEMLTADIDRTVDRATEIQWGSAERSVYFFTHNEGSYSLWRAGEDGTLETVLETDIGTVNSFSIGTNLVALAHSNWDHPGDVFIGSLSEGDVERVTEVNASYLSNRSVAEPEELWFESEDGTEVQGWVLRPPDFDPEDTYPMVVEIHGGPHAMWTTSGTMWHEFQLLAARGYVVFWCNPRGSTGYGEDFQGAIENDWGGVDSEDVLAGLEEVANRPYVDEESVFVTGGSYGGFMTAWLMSQTDRFAAGVSQRGVYDLWTFYSTTETERGVHKYVEWEIADSPWENKEVLWERSPSSYPNEFSAPLQIIHSENDYGVPINNAEILYQLLQKNDVETRLIRYPREGHDLSRSGEPSHVVDRLERIVEWFDGYSEYHESTPVLERDGEDSR